jgi:hypothetical protein
MKSLKKEQGFVHLALVVIVVLALVVGVGLYVYNRQQSKTTTSNTSTPTTTKKLSHPGVVMSEVFAASLDATGASVNPTRTFAANTPKIYVVLGLANAQAAQRVEYTRYLNGKFVDNGSIAVKNGAKYASFVFSLQPGKMHPKGAYVIKTYTNGIFERSATYTVQ